MVAEIFHITNVYGGTAGWVGGWVGGAAATYTGAAATYTGAAATYTGAAATYWVVKSDNTATDGPLGPVWQYVFEA